MAIVFGRKYLGLLLVFTTLFGGWLLALGYTVWRLHDEALEAGLGSARTYARNFEEHLTQTLQVIDLTAGSIDPLSEGKLDLVELSRRLTVALRPAPFLRSISLVGADGNIVASSSRQNIGISVDTTRFFPTVAGSETLLRVGGSWRGRDIYAGEEVSNDRPISDRDTSFVPVLRRLETKEPLWLLAAINPDYFINYSAHLIDANDGFVQWLRYDGALLISGSLAESPPRSSASLTIRERIAVREQGDFEHTLANRRFLESYRASSRYPVVVVVALDREEILASWIVEAKRLTAIVVPILVALTGALMLIWRRRQHIEAQGLEMERTRKLSASVFDASSDAIVLTKPDGEIISVNSAFERITGYTHPEAIGRNPRFLASGMQDRSFYKRLWDTLLAEGHWQGEIVNRKKNGELYTGWLTIDAVKDEKATLLHFVGVTTDITDRKRYEAELLEAKVKAEAGALAKTTFLATMSHEIRTPMNGILGMSELLLLTDLNSEQREQLSTIQSSAEALLSILNEILDFSRIEAQGVSVERVRFDPLRIVTDIVGLFGPRAEEKNLALRQQINGEYPHAVVGDPTRLRQILTNLVSNAVKFTQEGSITLTASADAGDRIESSTGDHDIYLNFLVKDTGIGIANDKQQLIFEPFSQADASTTRSYGGTGLGLTISRKIATALGGTLTLVSTPGQGSEFHLRIKTKAVQTRESEIDRRETNRRHVVRRPAGSLNILVAEDTLTNQKVIRAMLAKLGHEVHVVDDGAAAVEIARQRNFDVILMDMQMPVMSGLEATRAIRAENSKSGRHVRIIALTANAYDSDREACLAAGMNDFLSKPVALDALQEALAKHDRRMG